MSRETRSVVLDEVKSYRPTRLRSVETRVTRYGGHQEVEKKGSSGVFHVRIPQEETQPSRRMWFAPDYRPDLKVAVILPGLLLEMSNEDGNYTAYNN
ncbi:hypothetical protein JTE90_005728 [Oedothorax gibbosus]|uniref:Uncharacterized protein n=1 Tax=Oedothorax gibbosus TaxID=931172 RepID=A0AAV6TJ33_9ARAC|nr:hypothetical protein JTE90_005728 [Oedothorax gibbosus]